MGHINSSLALEDMDEQLEETVELSLLTRHLSISNAIPERKPYRAIKVCGSITISF